MKLKFDLRVIFILACCFVSLLIIFSCLYLIYNKSKQNEASIFELSSSDVRAIEIQPLYSMEISGKKHPYKLVVEDDPTISKVIGLLQNAKEIEFINHPSGGWACYLEIILDKTRYKIRVCKLENNLCYYIVLGSDKINLLNKRLRVDELGSILEKLMREK